MTMKLGDSAPDFHAQTTEGTIDFHDYIGDSWAVLFSHPKDFTPVCTTELGTMAKLKPEFDRRGVKVLGLSVDPVDKHEAWADDIEATQGAAPTTRSSATPTTSSRSSTGCSPPRWTATPPPERRPTTRPSATCSSSARTRRSSSCSSTP